MAKLLLVEDDNNLREIYEARLQAEGYSIVTAKDGEDALVVAKAEKPDLIISDVMMPKISGFEMLDILRNTDGLKEVKVIMLTALGQSDDQQRAGRLGADRYLVKSQVTLEDIVKVTHELLGDDATEATTPAPEAAPATPVTAPEAVAPVPAPEAPAAEAPVVAPTPEAVATPPAPVTPPAEPPTQVVADSTAAVVDEPAAEPVAPAAEPPTEAPEPTEPATETITPTEPVTSDNNATSSDEPAPTDEESSAQSMAQEEASVEAKIEDFVAGATSEAPAPQTNSAAAEPAPEIPAVEPVAAPAAPAETTVPAAVTPEAATATPQVVDDKLMEQAVDTLIADTEPVAAPAAVPDTDAPKIKAATSATDGSGGAPVAKAAVDLEAPVAADTEDEVAKPVAIAHKKVITPLDSEPKNDINTLLAVEAAKEAAAAPAPVATPIVSTNETGPAAPLPEPEVVPAAPSTTVVPSSEPTVTPAAVAPAPAAAPAQATVVSADSDANDPNDPSSIAL
jgi:CheY-like chemotaxis protein